MRGANWVLRLTLVECTLQMRVDSVTGKASLTVAEAFPRHAGSYTLVATNVAGEARCGCDVTVEGLPPCETSNSEVASDAEAARPSIKCALNDVSVREGESALLECVIVGYPEPEVRPCWPPVFAGRTRVLYIFLNRNRNRNRPTYTELFALADPF